MSKSYKSFIKEYSMGLQVPSTSYMKPIGDLISGKPLRKKESNDSDDELQGKQVFKRPKHMPKDSGGKLDLDEPTRSHSSLKKAKKVDAKPNDGSDHTQPSTKYKGLAFTQKVPNYVDG
jgi:hypothetical protein